MQHALINDASGRLTAASKDRFVRKRQVQAKARRDEIAWLSNSTSAAYFLSKASLDSRSP